MVRKNECFTPSMVRKNECFIPSMVRKNDFKKFVKLVFRSFLECL